MIKNREFKAKVNHLEWYEQKLLKLNPTFKGTDYQKDTYFNVGTDKKLKLREGNIENALIYYERPEVADEKSATILLYKHQPDVQLKLILEKLHGIDIIVEKERKIYFCDNIKVHFDQVKGLGTFLEVEAIKDEDSSITELELDKQCREMRVYFSIQDEQLLAYSYADLLRDVK